MSAHDHISPGFASPRAAREQPPEQFVYASKSPSNAPTRNATLPPPHNPNEIFLRVEFDSAEQAKSFRDKVHGSDVFDQRLPGGHPMSVIEDRRARERRCSSSPFRLRAGARMLALLLAGVLSVPGVASASVSSLSQGKGISLSPNPITSTGTISLALPLNLSAPFAGPLFNLTNTATATSSSALQSQGHTFGISGIGGARRCGRVRERSSTVSASGAKGSVAELASVPSVARATGSDWISSGAASGIADHPRAGSWRDRGRCRGQPLDTRRHQWG